MNKILIICGPTATGKTALAAKLAKKFNGELISADSRQVYRGMDIGTGKDYPSGVKIHLIDVVKPSEEFSVSHYYRLAWQAIKKIWEKRKLPILVGGTGFYIKAVIDGIETLGVSPDWELRKKLSNLDIKRLRDKLKRLDHQRWKRMNESDRKNPRRLIRSIEIAIKMQNAKCKMQNYNEKFKINDLLSIGLKAPFKVFYQRIDRRVVERVKKGAEKEVRQLLTQGYSWENSVLGATIGYKEWRDFLEGRITRKEVIQYWKYAEHAYARRQMTWFKKALSEQSESKGKWFDIAQKNWQNEVEKLVKKWYHEK